METERIALSQQERDRLRVLPDVQQGHLAQVEAAARVKLSDRQVRRLLLRLREQGDRAMVHGFVFAFNATNGARQIRLWASNQGIVFAMVDSRFAPGFRILLS